ncbi:MAG: hypothetical protein DHS20C15_03950 [Planctomycetota bacterium]|nr:MAG: hypothetical protein DHS20C15_03950 [Planctomycetota bacterium]
MASEDRQKKSKQSRGGEARAKKMTAAERSKSASQASKARWAGHRREGLPHAILGSEDRPLRIGEIEIPCYVLEDGRRVLSQRGIKTSIGMSGSGGSTGAHRMARFVASIEAKGVDTKGLAASINRPFRFVATGAGGATAFGYEATVLPELCNVILEARRSGKLLKRQAHFADRCEVLVRGLANVGIIALVDEATGYQEHRTQNALAEILEAFIADELQKWVPTFPAKFYRGLFRLWKIPFDPKNPSLRRPQFFGVLTNDLVYDRLAPGVRRELQRLNPVRKETGRRARKHHQYLTRDMGHPALKAHITALMALQDVSDTKAQFRELVDKALPKRTELPLFPDLEE